MDYEKLGQQDPGSADGSESWGEEDGMLHWKPQQIHPSTRSSTRRQQLVILAYIAILLVSVFLNGVYIRDRYTQSHVPATSTAETPKSHRIPSSCEGHDISPYAGVPRNQVKGFGEASPYHDSNDWNASHEMWKNLNIDTAMVALAPEEIEEFGLPSSEPFPWDTTKSLYVVHGMHSLHCLKMMYLEFKRYQSGEEAHYTWGHLSHCFETLRQQLVCDADDTLRAGVAGKAGSGRRQTRMCRDWDMYDNWLKNHTACYKHFDEPPLHDIDEFKYCPPGSGYVVRNDTYNGIDFFPPNTTDTEHQEQSMSD